jgi:hypothetical protein
MVGLVRAVASLGEAALGRHAIIGGVAVNARLGQAHRATADVDTVVDDTMPPDAVEALLALPGAQPDPTGEQRVRIQGTRVEVIGVGPIHDGDLDGVPTKDALFVASHSWALDTATPLTLIAGDDRTVEATAPFATPAALIAMKLHAIEDRSQTSGVDKRAGDAWDMYRLLLDLDADGSVRAALAAAPAELRALVEDAAQRVLVSDAIRTRGWLRAGDDAMAAVTAADLRHVGELLVNALH